MRNNKKHNIISIVEKSHFIYSVLLISSYLTVIVSHLTCLSALDWTSKAGTNECFVSINISTLTTVVLLVVTLYAFYDQSYVIFSCISATWQDYMLYLHLTMYIINISFELVIHSIFAKTCYWIYYKSVLSINKYLNVYIFKIIKIAYNLLIQNYLSPALFKYNVIIHKL